MCGYLENNAPLIVHIHDDSSALQRPDPQGELQLRLQLVGQSVFDVAVA